MTQYVGQWSGEMTEGDRHQSQYTPRMLALYFALTFAIKGNLAPPWMDS